MRTHTESIPCPLGRLVPPSPANPEELRAMRAAVWHQQGIVVLPLDEVYNDWDRAFLTGMASRFYGARTDAKQGQGSHSPWTEGDRIDRGDGETWTVIAATEQSVTLRRSRDGALSTLGQRGEGTI